MIGGQGMTNGPRIGNDTIWNMVGESGAVKGPRDECPPRQSMHAYIHSESKNNHMQLVFLHEILNDYAKFISTHDHPFL